MSGSAKGVWVKCTMCRSGRVRGQDAGHQAQVVVLDEHGGAVGRRRRPRPAANEALNDAVGVERLLEAAVEVRAAGQVEEMVVASTTTWSSTPRRRPSGRCRGRAATVTRWQPPLGHEPFGRSPCGRRRTWHTPPRWRRCPRRRGCRAAASPPADPAGTGRPSSSRANDSGPRLEAMTRSAAWPMRATLPAPAARNRSHDGPMPPRPGPPPARRCLAAPDAFKGTASAPAVAVGHRAGVRPPAGWELRPCPMSDGGEGFAEVLAAARSPAPGGGGARRRDRAARATGGGPVVARPTRVRPEAVIESAAASGLPLAGGADGQRPAGGPPPGARASSLVAAVARRRPTGPAGRGRVGHHRRGPRCHRRHRRGRRASGASRWSWPVTSTPCSSTPPSDFGPQKGADPEPGRRAPRPAGGPGRVLPDALRGRRRRPPRRRRGRGPRRGTGRPRGPARPRLRGGGRRRRPRRAPGPGRRGRHRRGPARRHVVVGEGRRRGGPGGGRRPGYRSWWWWGRRRRAPRRRLGPSVRVVDLSDRFGSDRALADPAPAPPRRCRRNWASGLREVVIAPCVSG